MTHTKIAFLVATTLALSAEGANAASLNPVAGALKESTARSTLVQRTHGCHLLCKCGHRHMKVTLYEGPTLCQPRACRWPFPRGLFGTLGNCRR
jgi:hypothetical protein